MIYKRLLYILFITLLFVGCEAATETAMPTALPPVMAEAPDVLATATAVPEPTAVPSATPTATPLLVDGYVHARQIVAAAPLFAPDGWQVEPCEGEAAVFCVSDGQENVGFAEFLLFALSGYSDDHILPLTAKELPTDAAAYTADQQLVAEQALMSLAEEHLAVIAEDRAITFPHDTFTPLEMEPLTMGALPALAFGFVRTDAAGEVQERYLNVAAFDQQFIYWFGINYDPANVSTFVSDTAVTQFAPAFHQIAASLPVP